MLIILGYTDLKTCLPVFNFVFVSYAWGLVYMHMCAPCVCLVPQKAEVPLELELQVATSHLVGAGSWREVL